MLKARMLRSIPLLAMLGLGACVGGPPIVTASVVACSTLLPPEWRRGVDPAPLPSGETVGDWIAFGDAQTARLDAANGRTRDAIGVVERCEARDASAVARASRGFFGRLFGG
jgi:hypothetical protein